MAHRGWLRLGDTELANTRRTVTYWENVACNQSIELVKDDSWPELARYLQHDDYTTPLEDPAPWVNRDEPATGDFLGVWVMGLEGLDSAPLQRETVEAVGGGGGFTAPGWSIREIHVEAILLAATPVGLEYGLEWLNSSLVQDRCEPLGEGRQLHFLAAAPYMGWSPTDQEVRAAGVDQERWLNNVVCTQPVEVQERFGQWDKDPTQKIAARVSFTLSSGNPFVWKSRRSLVAPALMVDGEPRQVVFERVAEDGSWSGTCDDPNQPLVDPSLPAPAQLPRPVTPASAVGYQPFQSRHLELNVPARLVRPWETMLPTVTIQAGDKDERSVRIQWVRGRDTSDLGCESIGEAMVGYIPAGATLTLDGVTGRATVLMPGEAVERDATSVVTGRNGAPWRPATLRCGDEHTLVVQAPQDVDAGALVAAYGSVRMN